MILLGHGARLCAEKIIARPCPAEGGVNGVLSRALASSTLKGWSCHWGVSRYTLQDLIRLEAIAHICMEACRWSLSTVAGCRPTVEALSCFGARIRAMSITTTQRPASVEAGMVCERYSLVF